LTSDRSQSSSSDKHPWHRLLHLTAAPTQTEHLLLLQSPAGSLQFTAKFKTVVSSILSLFPPFSKPLSQSSMVLQAPPPATLVFNLFSHPTIFNFSSNSRIHFNYSFLSSLQMKLQSCFRICLDNRLRCWCRVVPTRCSLIRSWRLVWFCPVVKLLVVTMWFLEFSVRNDSFQFNWINICRNIQFLICEFDFGYRLSTR